jgi:hypothetical protein
LTVFNRRTPAGFAMVLVGELYRTGRISLADKQALEAVILPVAEQEAERLKGRTAA